MLHVDHSRHAQSPGSSLPGTRVAAHSKQAAPLLARFLLTAQGAGASGLFSQPRVRHGAPEITEMLSETRLGNPTQTGDQELIESESRSSDLMEFPSETSLIGTPTSSLIIQTSSPRTKKRKRSWDSSEYANKTAKLGAVSSTKSWQSKWLNEFEWLKYENGAMYCSICILHKNKCKFSENGSTNFRISTLHEHETSTGHLRALNLRSDIQSKRIPSVSASITKKVDLCNLQCSCKLPQNLQSRRI